MTRSGIAPGICFAMAVVLTLDRLGEQERPDGPGSPLRVLLVAPLAQEPRGRQTTAFSRTATDGHPTLPQAPRPLAWSRWTD
jgi:hypothetical protein